MPYIRHESIFSLQELFQMEQKHRFAAVFEVIDISPLLRLVTKKSRYGAPIDVHHSAMIYSLIARIMERIPTIKDLVKRLREDTLFRMDCGFMLSENVPSEASYSRLIKKISQSTAMQEMKAKLVEQAWTEGFITDDTIAIDATHMESRDQAPVKQDHADKTSEPPKKRGRKSKQEHALWLAEKLEKEAAKSLYQKEIAAQLTASYEDLYDQMPLDPHWGVKKNSAGKNTFWFGYKGHFAVGTRSQYILGSMLSSGNMNDSKAAIPLLKGLKAEHSDLVFTYVTSDAGYDYEAIYQQIHAVGARAIIAYNRKREGELIGFDEHFAPTCVREHSYRYDSYDAKYQTLKYVRPKECAGCPLAHDSLCQKVYKIKITTDIRKYAAPARGTVSWKEISKRRSAVERVNAYLKEFFQLNNIRHRTGTKAKLHLDFVTLVYNAMKLASDRLRQQLQQAA